VIIKTKDYFGDITIKSRYICELFWETW